ncbi:MAG: hypothetical protein ACI9TH_003386 [Kiritimatiellia bacterium]|jgi:hypothetical protein
MFEKRLTLMMKKITWPALVICALFLGRHLAPQNTPQPAAHQIQNAPTHTPTIAHPSPRPIQNVSPLRDEQEHTQPVLHTPPAAPMQHATIPPRGEPSDGPALAASSRAEPADRPRQQAEVKRLYGQVFNRRPKNDPAVLSSTELARRSEQVAQEADWRLWMLEQDLALTDVQAAAIFPIYARASAAYHPNMVIEGETTAASDLPVNGTSLDEASVDAVSDAALVDEQIHALLDPEQQELIEEEWVERDAWWTDVIGALASDVDLEEKAGQIPSTIEEGLKTLEDLSLGLGIQAAAAPEPAESNE